MRTSDMIKSKFWRARDVEGQAPIVLTIADVTEELLGRGAHQDVKCFLWFNESLKGLQLNKTRVNILEAAFGPDSELWIGKRIRISFDPSVEFGGRAVGGICLQTPPGVIYTPGAGLPGWGEAPAAVPGRPPQPIWDQKRQQWITPQAAAQQAPLPTAPARPPPPVWNEATQQWETVNPGTGEIGGREPIPAGRGLGVLSGREQTSASAATEFDDPPPATAEFDDDIPF